MKFSLFVAAAGLLGLTDAFAGLSLHHQHAPLAPRQYRAMTKRGCYSSKGSMVLKNNTNIFNTQGSCQVVCWPLNKAVLATSASIECWCGDKIPAESYKVDDDKCNTPCAGSNNIECGGIGFWTVYTSGIIADVAVPQDASPSSSTTGSGSSATSVSPAVVTVGGATITATPSSSADGSSQKSSPNVTAIAAGVVIGFVAISAIAAGVVLFMRNKKRRQIEEEHRSAAAISNFVNGGKTSPHSAGSSFTDARLDPAVMGRRISVGSIADDQDYSRKILRVTNA